MENAFTVAQSYGNVIEVALCLVAFGLSVRSSYESKLQSIFLVCFPSHLHQQLQGAYRICNDALENLRVLDS